MTEAQTAVEIPGYVAGTWDVDPIHSSVSFVVRHLGLARFRRSFAKFSGTIVTTDNPLDSSVTATVQVDSFDTGLPVFNEHLLAAAYFDAANHPEAAFRSTALRPVGERFALDGELTLRGVTKEVTLDLESLGFGTGMSGEQKAAFSASTTIDRRDFGLAFDGKLPDGRSIVGERVSIHFEIEAVLA
jgi:polyisoprenoid-binding protein YceI